MGGQGKGQWKWQIVLEKGTVSDKDEKGFERRMKRGIKEKENRKKAEKVEKEKAKKVEKAKARKARTKAKITKVWVKTQVVPKPTSLAESVTGVGA